jgi:hypothetical protein
MTDQTIAIPQGLLRPLPLTIREHPERHARARVTLVREVLVALAANHPPITAPLKRVTSAPLLASALNSYTHAADEAAHALGLGHRRELFTPDDGPLSIRHDVGDILALAQLDPARLNDWAVATGLLHIALDHTDVSPVRQAITTIGPLAPSASWLVPALVRWAHLRIYEVVIERAVPPELARYIAGAVSRRRQRVRQRDQATT